ncbi:MAG TPA: hypothetical protein VIP11_12490 [Gemmatimonadaceae bacterium]
MMMSKFSLRSRRARWAGLVTLITSASLACTDKPETAPIVTTDPGPLIRAVIISPVNAVMVVGDSLALTGVTDVKPPNPGVDRGVQWSSLSLDVVTIDSRGMVTAVVGEARIIAKANADPDVKNDATIRVIARP